MISSMRTFSMHRFVSKTESIKARFAQKCDAEKANGTMQMIRHLSINVTITGRNLQSLKKVQNDFLGSQSDNSRTSSFARPLPRLPPLDLPPRSPVSSVQTIHEEEDEDENEENGLCIAPTNESHTANAQTDNVT